MSTKLLAFSVIAGSALIASLVGTAIITIDPEVGYIMFLGGLGIGLLGVTGCYATIREELK